VACRPREAHAIVHAGFDFRANENFRFSAGVKNLFDKQLPQTGEGASICDEPGRSCRLSLAGTL